MPESHEITDAIAELVLAGIDPDTAMRCLGVLTNKGFLITRTQHLLDTVSEVLAERGLS